MDAVSTADASMDAASMDAALTNAASTDAALTDDTDRCAENARVSDPPLPRFLPLLPLKSRSTLPLSTSSAHNRTFLRLLLLLLLLHRRLLLLPLLMDRLPAADRRDVL